MSDNLLCKEARELLGFTQTVYGGLTDRDRTAVSRIETGAKTADGAIVSISDLVLRMNAPDERRIEAQDIAARLMDIPKGRRTAWAAHKALVLLCVERGRLDLISESAGLEGAPAEDAGGEEVEKKAMDAMRHQAEDFKKRLIRWLRQAPAESRGEIKNAIEASGNMEHWIEMALETERLSRKSEPKSPPGDPPDGGGG